MIASKRYKTIFAFVLILSLALCIVAVSSESPAAYAEPLFSADWTDGIALSTQFTSLSPDNPVNSEVNPYIIATANDLALLAARVNTGEPFSGIYFRQTENIDLNGKYFISIGYGINTPFSGYYDGYGKTLSNLFIDPRNDGFSGNDSGNYIGLFGCIKKPDEGGVYSRVINVTILSGAISGYRYVGAIAGGSIGLSGGEYVTNCVNYASVDGYELSTDPYNASKFIGGIVGQFKGNSLSKCTNYGDVKGASFVGGLVGNCISNISEGKNYGAVVADSADGNVGTIECIGGLVGKMENGGSSIKKSFNVGSVTGNKGAIMVGGVVGFVSDSAVLENCYNSGNVIGSIRVGGVIGNGQTITNGCYNAARVESNAVNEPDVCIGGIIGYNGGNITDAYNSGEVVAADGCFFVGGVVGREDMASKSMYCYYNKSFYAESGGIGSVDGGIESAKSYDSEEKRAKGYDIYELIGLEPMLVFYNPARWGFINVNSDEGFTPLLKEVSGAIFQETPDYSIIPDTGARQSLFGRIASPSGDAFGSSELNPYVIENDAQLKWFYYNVNTNKFTYASKYIELAYDITIVGTIAPLGGLDGTAFEGHFDGKGHTIDDLYILDTARDTVGFFGVIRNAEIKNIIFTDFKVYGKDYVGVVAGKSENSIISNIRLFSTGTINGIYYVGGLIGKAVDTAMSNISSENYTVYGHGYLGGLIGDNTATVSEEIIDITTKGITVQAIINSGEKIGGVVGSSDKVKYENLYLEATVRGNNYLGGAVGWAQYVDIDKMVLSAYSRILGTGTCVGGVIGSHSEGHYRAILIYDAELSSVAKLGGVFGEARKDTVLTDVASNVTLSSFGDYVGGLGGYAVANLDSSIIFLRSYSVSDLQGDEYIGGLLGKADGSGKIISLTDCYFSGTVASISKKSSIYSIIGCNTENVLFSENVYYNSDTISLVTLNNLGTGKNLLGMTASGLDGLYSDSAWFFKNDEAINGYYPQSAILGGLSLDTNDYSTKICLEPYFDSGEGTSLKPYKLSTELQLIIMQGLIDRAYAGYGAASYELTEHITLTKEFVPIASEAYPFNGSFNGAYYEIKNFVINRPTEDYVGFFRAIGNDGMVYMLSIQTDPSSESAVSGRDYVGGIAGKSTGSIRYSYNRAVVSGRTYVGGIAGFAESLVYTFNTGTVSGNNYVGGLTGENEGVIEFSFNSGYLTVSSGIGYVGGLIGYNKGGVNYCYNSGGIKNDVTDAYVGGLIGRTDELTVSTINNCYTVGFFEGAISESHIGALVGVSLLSRTQTLQYSYYNREQAVILKDIPSLQPVASGNTTIFDSASVYALTTYNMVGSVALSRTNMNFNVANFISEEEQSQDANFSPQLKYFYNLTLGDSSNAQEGTVGNLISLNNIQQLSKESARLGLFGKDSSSINTWGGESNPYLISTPDHLKILEENVNLGFSYEGCYFSLTTDLDLLGRSFSPIGKYYFTKTAEDALPFSGVFNGRGFSISNLIIDETNPDMSLIDYSVGFFGYLTSGAEVRNLRLDSSCQISGNTTVGAVVGYNYGRLYRVFSSASVSGVSGVGGLVGNQRGNIIESCLCDGIVSATDGGIYASGLVKEFNNTEINPALNARIFNSWYVTPIVYSAEDVDISYDHSSKRGSIIYMDTQGKHNVVVSVDFNAVTDDTFIKFVITPYDGYGYSVRYYPSEEEVNLGGTDPNATYYTMENSAVRNGSEVKWYIRFTKEVILDYLQATDGDVAFSALIKGSSATYNDVPAGDYSYVLGYYYNRQEVIITTNASDGYYLVLDESTYSYRNDAANNVQIVFTMPDNAYDLVIIFKGFGVAGVGNSVGVNPVKVIEGTPETLPSSEYTYDETTNSYSFDYDQIEKGFIAEIAKSTGYFLSEIKYIFEGSYVRNPTRAGDYSLEILLRDTLAAGGNVYIGTKTISFSISKVQLVIDQNVVVKAKEYDGKTVSEVNISQAAINGIIAGDEVFLSATMTFPDSTIGSGKTVVLSFATLNLTGEDAVNYAIPAAVTMNDGEITKRKANVLINEGALVSPYTGEAPYISAASVEGLLITDSNYRFQYSFTFCDEEGTLISTSNPQGTVGYYRVSIDYTTLEGLDNYSIDIYGGILDENSGHYYKIFRITPKIISSMTFSGYDNLVYNGNDLLTGIKARYARDEYTQGEADLTLYYGNSVVTECVNAGDYYVMATISDINFVVSGEISQTFSVSKIAATTPLVLNATYEDNGSTEVVGSLVSYGVAEINLSTTGGNGEGLVSYELISGEGTIYGNVLGIKGTGVIAVRAKKAESTNYYQTNSETLTFTVIKAVLTASLNDTYVTYGDEIDIEIVYSGFARGEASADEIEGLIAPDLILPDYSLNAREEGYKIELRDNGYADGYVIDVSNAEAYIYVSRKDIIVRAVANNKIYGTIADRQLTYNVSEQGLALNGELKRAIGETAGDYLIMQNTLSNENNPNYNIHYSPAYFTIQTKELRVSVPDFSKVFGASDPTPEFIVDTSTLAFNDTLSVLSGTIKRTQGENVGRYPYSATATAGTNYFVNLITVGVLSIVKATPAITDISVGQINYGETLSYSQINANSSIEGVFSWEKPLTRPSVFDSEHTEFAAKFVPTDDRNYSTLPLMLKVEVKPIDAMINFIGATEVFYDGTNKNNFEILFSNVISGDAISYDLTCVPETAISAGDYVIKATLNDNNYYLAQGTDSITLHIHKSELKIKYKSSTIAFGDEYTPEFIYEGFKADDSVSTLTKLPKIDELPEEPGIYTLTPKGAEVENYLISYVSGQFIVQRTISITDIATIEGVVSPDMQISATMLTKNNTTYDAMSDRTKKTFAEDEVYKGWRLDGFVFFSYSQNLSKKVNYTVVLNEKMTEDSVFVLYNKDGSVELLKDYSVENGELHFSGEGISGIGTIREATTWEKYQNTIIYSGSAVIIVVIIVLFVLISRKRKRKKDAKFSVLE